MFQIDTATAAAVEPTPSAPGTPGYFTDGNPVLNIPATVVSSDWFNAITDELLAVLTAAGITPTKTTHNQVITAIKNLIEANAGSYALDIGATNAYVVALSPAVTAYTNGLPVRFRASHANTGACTLNAGGGVVSLLRDDGSPLQSKDIPVNGIVSCSYDTPTTSFLLNSIVPSQLGNTYAGNPNGNIAGNAATSGGVIPAILWDTVNNILWICTTTGTTSTAVWTEIGSNAAWPYWCGTSTGTANAQTVTTPSAMQALTTGTVTAWKVGVGLTNTNATTLTVGTFGTIPLRKDGPSGPIALTGGELVAGNIVSGRYDGTYIHLAATEMGTAALANASSNTGTLAAVSGAIVAGHLAVFTDTFGTVGDGGPAGVAAAPTYVNSTSSLLPGVYLTDTTAGGFTITLTASPVQGSCYEFIDANGTWSPNNLIINMNGHTIMGVTDTLTCNVAGEDFRIWYNGSDWRLE